MIANSGAVRLTACPTADLLAAFDGGRLAPADWEAVAEHVRDCSRCSARLTGLGLHEDTLILTLRRSAQPGSLPIEPECRRMEATAQAIDLHGSRGAALAPVPPEAESFPAQVANYQLLNRLGEGGMGAVYLARHVKLRRLVALKLLPADRLSDPHLVARFAREMEILGQLNDPHVVRPTDAGEDQGWHYLAMEFLEGIDLSRLLKRVGRFRIADACEVVRQAALGLQHLHDHDLVHRDVKPSNLLLTPEGVVKVLDLGLARFSPKAAASAELTRVHELMGTEDYMAPEQRSDPHRVDIRADVYSLGCTLYKLLTEEPPGDASGAKLRDFRPDAPQELIALTDRLLARSPGERPAVPVEVAEGLVPFTAGCQLAQLVSATQGLPAAGWEAEPNGGPPAPTPDGPAFRPRRSWLLWGSLAVLLLVGVGIGVAVVTTRSEIPPASPPQPAPPPEPLAAGVWHNLLQTPPETIEWFPACVPFQFEAPLRRLAVHHAEGQALLGLGSVPPKTAYKFQVTIQQPGWPAHIGIFFGHHQLVDQKGPCTKYQLLMLRPYMPWNGKPLQLVRLKRTIRPPDPNDPVLRESPEVFASWWTPIPPLNEERLEIEVGRTGDLLAVTWGGVPYPLLVTPDANRPVTETGWHGRFGVAVFSSAGVFQDARLMIEAGTAQ